MHFKCCLHDAQLSNGLKTGQFRVSSRESAAVSVVFSSFFS